MRSALVLPAVAMAAALALVPAAVSGASPAAGPLPPRFVRIEAGPAGGSVWQGLIPNPLVPGLRRPTVVYLPPGFTSARRYPLVVFLHGFPGSPYEFVSGLDLAASADRAIAAGTLPPFVAVVPPAGIDVHHGDWTGVWESYLVDRIVPWADRYLPLDPRPAGRVLTGLSAGGYGAIDIGLRHPRLFGTLESWSGYFTPLRAGALRHAGAAALAAHDPSLLVAGEAPLLRRLGTRFYLSSGTTHDRAGAFAARTFSQELRQLGLPHLLLLAPGGHDGAFWRRQLGAALRYALAPA
jgi:enterochelin esterase-like enzyme